MESTKKQKLLNLLWAFLSVAVVALIANLFSERNSEWYNNLAKASEWPPAFLFPIMWSIIYFLVGLSIYFMLNSGKMNKKMTILLVINGIVNILWCLLFFTLESTIGGLIMILFNLVASILLVREIDKDKPLGYFLTIYPLWVSFATMLNLAVWILN